MITAAGAIEANNQNLSIHASELTNSRGHITHAGDGALQLAMATLDNSQGEITGNGVLNHQNGTRLNQNGTLSARQISLTGSGDINNTQGTIEADQLTLTIDGQLTNDGGRITQFGTSDQNISAKTISNSKVEGQSGRIGTNAANLTVTADELTNSGELVHAGEGLLSVISGWINNAQGKVLGNGDISLETDTLTNTGGKISGDQLTITNTGKTENSKGQLLAKDELQLSGTTLDNSEGTIAGETINLASTGAITNRSGTMESQKTLEITGSQLNNSQGTVRALGEEGQTQLTITGKIDNSAGAIEANNQNLSISASELTNGSGHITHAGDGTLQLTMATLNNSQGEITGNGILNHKNGNRLNQSGTLSARQINLTGSGDIDNTQGTIEADQLTLTIDGQLTNDGGRITQFGSSDQNLSAKTVSNGKAGSQSGRIETNAANLTVTTDELTNSGVLVHAGAEQLNLNAGALNNHGTLYSKGAIHSINSSLNNTGGTFAGRDVTVTAAADVNNENGLFETREDLAITAQGEINNTTGTLRSLGAAGELSLDAAAVIKNKNGLIELNGSTLNIKASEFNNNNGTVRQASTGQGEITVSGNVSNRDGLLLSKSELSVNADDLDNTDGQIHSTGGLAFGLSSLNNTDGLIYNNHASTLSLDMAGSSLDNSRGRLVSRNSLSVNASTLQNNDGLIQAGTGLTLSLPNFTNAVNSQLLFGESFTLNSGDFINHGRLATDGDLNLNLTGSLTNSDVLTALGNMSVNAASLDNRNGATITGGADSVFRLGGTFSNQGRLTSAGNMEVHAASVNNAGTLGSGEDLSIYSSGAITNNNGTAGSLIFSAGDMGLYGSSLVNRYADIYSIGDLRFARNDTNSRADLLTNRSGRIESQEDINISAGVITNQKDKFKTDETKKYSRITVRCTDCGGTNRNGDATLLTVYEEKVLDDSPLSQVVAGGDVKVQGQRLINSNSLISADKNITLTLDSLENEGEGLGERKHYRSFNIGRKKKYRYRRDLSNINSFNAANSPTVTEVRGDSITDTGRTNNQFKPGNQTSPPGWLLGREEHKERERSVLTEISGGAKATIQAGGNVSITASNRVQNGVVQERTNTVAPATRELSSTATGQDLVAQSDLTISQAGAVAAGGRIVEASGKVSGVAGTVAGDNQSTTVNTSGNTADQVTASTSTDSQTNGINGSSSQVGSVTGQTETENQTLAMNSNSRNTVSASEDSNLTDGTGVGRVATEGAGVQKATASTDTDNHSDSISGSASQVSSVASQTETDNQILESVEAREPGVQKATASTDAESQSGSINGSALGADKAVAQTEADFTPQETAQAQEDAETASASVDKQIDTEAPEDKGTVVYINTQPKAEEGFDTVNPLDVAGFLLPEGDYGLFTRNDEPDHPYLIETNPALTDYATFIGSDYMLDRLDYNDDLTTRRLGDGFYEQRLIRQAIVEQTGQRFLTSALNSDYDQYVYLMDNAVESQQALSLSVGVELSEAQIAALTHDIVWMVEQEVAGETVLVPVLYLAKTRPTQIQPDGSLIAGQNIELIGGAGLENMGTLAAVEDLDIQAVGTVTNTGVTSAGRDLSVVSSEGDIINRDAGLVRGANVSLIAGRDITNQRQAVTYQWGSDRHGEIETITGDASRIEAGTARLQANRDIAIVGSELEVDGTATLNAGRDLTIASVADRERRAYTYGKSREATDSTRQLASSVDVGGDLQLAAGSDLQVSGSRVSTDGDLNASAGENLSLLAATNEDSYEYHYKSKKKKVTLKTAQVRQQSSELVATGNVQLSAGTDLTIIGSQVEAGESVSLAARQDIEISSAQNSDSYYYLKKKKKSFGRKSARQSESYNSTNVASVIDAEGDITINSQKTSDGSLQITESRDVTIAGSQLAAGEDLIVAAGDDVEILSGVEEHGSYSKKTKSGFLGLSKSGKSKLKTKASHVASTLEADNDVVVAAGDDIRLRASQTNSGNDTELRSGLIDETGSINLVSGTDTEFDRETKYKKKVGLSISDNFISVAEARKKGQETLSRTNVASDVSAERDASLIAEEDINVIGSSVSAGRNLALNAGRDITVEAVNEGSSNSQWNEKKRTGIGFESDDNGISVFAGSEKNKLREALAKDQQAASQLSAGQDITAASGRDITISSSDLNAGQDIKLQATDNIRVTAGHNTTETVRFESEERNGLTISMQHNFKNTKDALKNTGKGDNGISKGSSVLRTVDAIDQFASGPSFSGHLGKTATSTETINRNEEARGSNLTAGRDVAMTAGETVELKAANVGARRDITLAANDIEITTEDNKSFSSQEYNYSKTGTNMNASKQSASIGEGRTTQESDYEQTAATGKGSQLIAGNQINARATNDQTITGSSLDAKDINLVAGNDLTIEAAEGRYDSEENSKRTHVQAGIRATIGSNGVAFGFNAQAGYGESDLDREGNRFTHSTVNATDNLTLSSGRDTTIEGANLAADHVELETGRNLTVASVTDTGKVDGKRTDVDIDVTVGYGFSASGSVGYGESDGKTNWVEKQTTITGRDSVAVNTQDNTHIEGAVISAGNGKDQGSLTVDTGTLTYSDIHGESKEKHSYTQLSGSYGDFSKSNTDEQGNSWGIEGSYSNQEKEQIVRATVGEGTITVRDNPEQDLSDLNRDTDKAYEITKDEDETTELYVTSSALDALDDMVLSEEEKAAGKKNTFEKWKEGFKSYVEPETYKQIAGVTATAYTQTINNLRAYLNEAPEEYKKALGAEVAETVFDGILKAGGTTEQAEILLKDETVRNYLENLHFLAQEYSVEEGSTEETQASDRLTVEENYNCNQACLRGTILYHLGAAAAYVESLPEESQYLIQAGLVATLGPVKAALTVGKEAVADALYGDAVDEALNKAGIYATAAAVQGSFNDDETFEESLSSVEGAHNNNPTGDPQVKGAVFIISAVFGGVVGSKVYKKYQGHSSANNGSNKTKSGQLDNNQLPNSVVDDIRNQQHGQRPDPSEYLSANYIKEHLALFNDGATRFMTKKNLDKYGVGQRDGTAFVMTKKQADELLTSTNGNPRKMEKALGLPENFLEGNELVRVDIPNPKELNVRIPSGNEAGANEMWIPGGKLPDGMVEAVIDVGDVPSTRYDLTPLKF